MKQISFDVHSNAAMKVVVEEAVLGGGILFIWMVHPCDARRSFMFVGMHDHIRVGHLLDLLSKFE